MKHTTYRLAPRNAASAQSLISFMRGNYNTERNKMADMMQATWNELPIGVCHGLLQGSVHSQACGDDLIVIVYEHKYRVTWLNKLNDIKAGSTIQGSDNLEAALNLARDMAKHFGHAEVYQSEPTSRDWHFDLHGDGSVKKLEM